MRRTSDSSCVLLNLTLYANGFDFHLLSNQKKRFHRKVEIKLNECFFCVLITESIEYNKTTKGTLNRLICRRLLTAFIKAFHCLRQQKFLFGVFKAKSVVLQPHYWNFCYVKEKQHRIEHLCMYF